ncbi:MAG: cytochrome c biogenesis protein ResB [Ruminococcaceae bacterium]|nr:cytochrome c biogenesis protein ResB [Oscillospiraceae bacterium]
MKRRVHTVIGLLLLGITLFFLVLTILFSAGVPVNFRGIAVTAVLTFGGILMAGSLVFARPSGNLPKRIGFYLTHAGIVLMLAGFALFELGGDSVTAAVPVSEEVYTYYSNIQRENGEICDLGFNICVENFEIERYDDGSDRQYSADLLFADAVTLKVENKELSVNHPVRKNGWKIYLMNHGKGFTADGIGEYVNLLFRRDPGEYVVKAGVIVLAAGTVLELLVGNAVRPHKKTKEESAHD